jgi:hypothetical protein
MNEAIVLNTTNPKMELVTVTPELAKRWLACNTANFRRADSKKVAVIRGALERGEWAINGDAIRFSQDGRLIDGQHRLMACVSAQISFETFVVRGIDARRAEMTIDFRQNRTLGQLLGHHGYKNAATLASVARRAWARQITRDSINPVRATNEQIVRFIEENDDIHACVSYAKVATKPHQPTLIGSFLFEARQVDYELANDFAGQLLNLKGYERDRWWSRDAVTAMEHALMRVRGGGGEATQSKEYILYQAFLSILTGNTVRVYRVLKWPTIPRLDG